MTSTVAVLRTVSRRFALDRQASFWMKEIDPTWSLTEVRARVVDVIDETHDVKTFVLAPNGRWRGHLAGQFVTVEVEIAGVRTTRCYSLSSAPGARRLAITVKRVADGRVSSWMHDNVRRGDVLRLGQASGDFVLPGLPPRRLLLVSGGSGVTPAMAILRDLARRGALRDVVFVHAARSARDVIFRDELDALAARHAGLRVLFFLDDAGDPAARGRLDGLKLREAVPDLIERHTMLCGPTPMMAALAPIWTEAGAAHRLVMERFAPAAGTPVVASATDRAPGKVRLTLAASGRSHEAEGQGTLLEELEAAGERPENGCRMGICNTCGCRKRSGVVENTQTGEVSGEPDEDIRLCVSRARTDLDLDL